MLRGVVLFCATASVILAQERIWDGAYTEAQAARGREAYLKSCTNCHGLDVGGTVRAPSLKGERFLLSWGNGSVANLFRKIRDSMPATYPDTVAEDVKIDIIAYLLKENSFPAGRAELKVDEKDLEGIQIAQKGSSGVPNFALVQVEGCLAQGVGKTWNLTKASEPVVVKDDAVLAGQELGSASYLLVSVGQFNPAALSGRRLEARGLLYRDASGARLNLTALHSTAATCD